MGLCSYTGQEPDISDREEYPVKKQLISGLSAIALLAVADVAVAQEKGGREASPSAAPGANVGAEYGNEGAPASEKGAVQKRPITGAQKAPENGKSSQRVQSGEPGAPAEKKATNALKDSSGAKDRKEGSSSTGAASGESGTSSPSAAEGRSETSGKQHVSLSGDQRTRVQTVFKGHRGSARSDVHVDARIGVAVPRTVTLIEMPEDVVVLVPEWRQYRYILIGDEICIVDPETFEIIDVIAAV
jgi:hypothetical protein